MENKLNHSITAYSCRICLKYKSDNLLSSNKVDIFELLKEYFEYIRKCKIDNGIGRAIKLSEAISEEQISGNIKRIIIKPDAGKALENFSVINTKTNKVQKFDGDKNSAMYSHYVFCYTGKGKTIFVFHHYGQSGCKTVFLKTFNNFLKDRKLIAHFDVLLSKEMFNENESYIPEKLKLITTYNALSTDKADNVQEEQKKIEQEIIISLRAPRAKSIQEWIKNIKAQPNIEELRELLIQNDYSDNFEEAKVSVKFGKVSRLVSLSEFSGLIAEYDITDKIEIMADRTICEKLFPVVDDYALSFFEQE